MFEGKKILITGGTGSFGQALTKRLLDLDVDTVRIFSRNENKQITMDSNIKDDRLRFFIGDVRDLPRLNRALEDIDIVFHAAALKHVPVVEYNPFEAIHTNVIGSQNVIEACLHENVEKAICIGTDKAVSPLNTYGATKLLMEKLFVTASNYLNKQKHATKFIALRYGNVLGSSGSVILKFIEQIKLKQKIPITHPEMTRFSLTMDHALDFVLNSTEIGIGSEIFVPKLRSYSIMTLKDALEELLEEVGYDVVGIRTGEKIHEVLINDDEKRNVGELNDKYVIFNSHSSLEEKISHYKNMKIANFSSSYSSDKVDKISKDELKDAIKKNILEKDIINNN